MLDELCQQGLLKVTVEQHIHIHHIKAAHSSLVYWPHTHFMNKYFFLNTTTQILFTLVTFNMCKYKHHRTTRNSHMTNCDHTHVREVFWSSKVNLHPRMYSIVESQWWHYLRSNVIAILKKVSKVTGKVTHRQGNHTQKMKSHDKSTCTIPKTE